MSNIIKATFADGERRATTEALYQWDYGQVLEIDGLELPHNFEVHFGNSGSTTTVTQIATDGVVTIPDAVLTVGKSVDVFIYLHTGQSDGETEYRIVIPVRARQQPTHETPTPVQQTEIEQALAAMEAVSAEIPVVQGNVDKLHGLFGGVTYGATERVEGGTRILNQITADRIAAQLGFYYDTDENKLYTYHVFGKTLDGDVASTKFYMLIQSGSGEVTGEEMTFENAAHVAQQGSGVKAIYKFRHNVSNATTKMPLVLRLCVLYFDADGNEIGRHYSAQYEYTLENGAVVRTRMQTAAQDAGIIEDIGLSKNVDGVSTTFAYISRTDFEFLPVVSTFEGVSWRFVIQDSWYADAQYGYALCVRDGTHRVYCGPTIYQNTSSGLSDETPQPLGVASAGTSNDVSRADHVHAIPTVVAQDFSVSAAYSFGDYVLYNGQLYRFVVDHAAGAWNANDVIAAIVGNDIDAIGDELIALDRKVEKDTLLTRKKVIATTNGASIASSAVQFYTNITAGTKFSFSIVEDQATLTKYGIYMNGSLIQNNCVPGTVYDFTRNANITTISIYSNTVTRTGSVTAVLSVHSPNQNSLEGRMDSAEAVEATLWDASKQMPQPINLFDKTAVTTGKYVNASTGELANGYNATDYIPVRRGVKYYVAVIETDKCALYDKNKNYLSTVTTASDMTNTWYFTPAQDGFFRGSLLALTYADNAYVSPVYNVFAPYNAQIDFSYNSPINTQAIATRAVGVDSGNLFTGGSFWGDTNNSTGAAAYSKTHGVVLTSFIPIQGDLFWIITHEKSGSVGYIYEYNASKELITFTQSSGKQVGFFRLNSSTRYIRIKSLSTATSSPDALTPEIMDNSLFVTNDLKQLIKYVSKDKVAHRDATPWDFYQRSVTFLHDYVEAAIESYKDTIWKAGYDFVMPINTDLHTLDSEPFNMLTYMSESGTADVCFNLGDNIGWSFSSGEEAAFTNLAAVHIWSNSPYKKCPLVVLRGNHDNHPISGHVTDPDWTVSNAQFYNAMQERTQPYFAGTNKSYGYIDFPQSKIRVIFLDSGDIYDDDGDPITSAFNVTIRQKQLDWFCGTALDFSGKADKAYWSVITCSHAQLKQLAETAFNAILKAFMTGGTASGSQTKNYTDTGKSETLTYNVNFTNQGPIEYICHVNGHNHYDGAFLMGDLNRYDIDICADSQTERGSYDGSTVTPYTWTAGTIEERCMDTMCIDKASKMIYMKRLGVGSDRSFSYSDE